MRSSQLRAANEKSNGVRTTLCDAPNNACARASPVSVVTLTTTSGFIRSLARRSTRPRIALTSPTETAWIRMRGRSPRAGSATPRPSLAGQSVRILPVQIMRTSHSGAVTITRIV